MSHRLLVPEMLTLNLSNLIRNYYKGKPEKLVFVQSEESFTNKHSTKSFDKYVSPPDDPLIKSLLNVGIPRFMCNTILGIHSYTFIQGNYQLC